MSSDGRYRYRLGRRWATGPPVVWIMLNPSTAMPLRMTRPSAGASPSRRHGDTPRLRSSTCSRCGRRTRRSCYLADDPVGPGNDEELAAVTGGAALAVAAWGAHRAARARFEQVAPDVTGRRCSGVTSDGSPRHPSRLAASQTLTPWPVAGTGAAPESIPSRGCRWACRTCGVCWTRPRRGPTPRRTSTRSGTGAGDHVARSALHVICTAAVRSAVRRSASGAWRVRATTFVPSCTAGVVPRIRELQSARSALQYWQIRAAVAIDSPHRGHARRGPGSVKVRWLHRVKAKWPHPDLSERVAQRSASAAGQLLGVG